MSLASASERFALAQTLVAVKQSVAEAIAGEYFLLHSVWVARYGERGRGFCTSDTIFHIDFLVGAVQANSSGAFADYVRWTARMLGARGIDIRCLGENLDLLEKHLAPVLLPAQRIAISEFLSLGRQACEEPWQQTQTNSRNDRLVLAQRAFLAAIVGGQRQAALAIVEQTLAEGATHIDIYIDIFTESLRCVGDLWEQNKISVAQEHMATLITQYTIAMIYPRLVSALPSLGNMVVTGVAGELHQIGANLVADAMEAKGWTVRFLGTNLPHSTVLTTMEEFSTDVLCVSTTLVANLPSTAELVLAVQARFGKQSPRVVLGGSAHRMASGFAAEVGVTEAIADLRQGLAIL